MAAKRSMPAPRRGSVLTLEELQYLERKHGQKSPRQLYPKQVTALSRNEHEIAFGGGKFSGKSLCGIYFLIKGNSHTDECGVYRTGTCDCPFPDFDGDGNPNLVNRSYIHHPKYLACVVRKNSTDLLDWIREARLIYSLIGGDFKDGKNRFEFPSGAMIFCGHYDEENAYMKYQGLNVVRFLLEEATQIPDVKRLKMLKSCCRSIYPEMRAQMMLTCNPGGPGNGWVMDRYVEPLDEDGNVIPPLTTITEEFDSDELYAKLGVPRPAGVGDKIKSTRVFVFATVKDNPGALTNTDYLASLMEMDEEEREAYLFGNWRVMSGEFFKTFRPKGPARGEPVEANHVIPYDVARSRIQPWWWRTMAMDYGYAHQSVTLWGCHDQDTGQFIVTDEMAVSQTEPDVIGEEIARRTLPILKGLESPTIVMGLSHDAYGLRQDDRSVAELIGRGMSRILGPNMVHLPDLMVDKLKDQMEEQGHSTATLEAEAIFDRIRSQQHMGITIRRMRDNRVVGWQLLRSMLRWKSSLPEIKDIFDPNLASRISYEKGIEAYNSYLNLFRQKHEVLPKMLIVGPPVGPDGRTIQGTGLGCAGLISAVPKAIRSDLNPEDVTKKHVEGASDYWDAWRYLAMAYRGQAMPEPFEALRRRRIAEARQQNPNVDCSDLVWLNRKIEREQKQKTQIKPIHVIRPGRSARAMVKGLIAPPR